MVAVPLVSDGFGSDRAQPIHMHRPAFELVEVEGKQTGEIMKDTVVVPSRGNVMIEMVADRPGLALMHGHVQQNFDYKLKILLRFGGGTDRVARKNLASLLVRERRELLEPRGKSRPRGDGFSA
jgi:hypothetical protein